MLNNFAIWLFYFAIVLYCGCYNRPDPLSQITQSEEYILIDKDLPEYENNIDHARFINSESEEFYHKGLITYRAVCYDCHGSQVKAGSIPNSTKFWQDTFKMGNDPYAMYETITKGFGMMAPQINLTPQEKYEVIAYIRQEFIKEENPDLYFEVDSTYLASLPKGTSMGPEPQEYKPWAEMDYGNHLMYTYELANTDDPPRERSEGIGLLPNEDYSGYNFAYKGIAIRLDKGKGGVAAGNTFALFDHDLMRFAGFWTGEGFIDYRAILLNDEHNIYPRTVGQVQVENPVGPGWANPSDGSYEDPRFEAEDGRPFGPLPREWAHYKGLYQYQDKVVIKYTVGGGQVLEYYQIEESGKVPVVSRTFNITPLNMQREVRLAPSLAAVSVICNNCIIDKRDEYHVLTIPADQRVSAKVYISSSGQSFLDSLALTSTDVEDLSEYLSGGPSRFSEDVLTTKIIRGESDGAYVVDVFTLPIVNPWKSRMRLTGIDFINNGKDALVTTIDGEVWRVEGISNSSGQVSWHRIASGLFQPLGIKYHKGQIYVGCRDQIVKLHDLNNDGETDYYESFNSDHMVTEHFHEFAMGLQVDEEGNFYYAKSARHARKALTPQHGTLMKVSPDGLTSEILASGFRAANGVCLNSDGSFYVTDQEGHWNPMNRINKVEKGGWYGNMYTLQAPKDTSDKAMIQPMAWIDSKIDRSPAELLWVDSERWGPLNGKLLNLSYGYGKMFHVITQTTSDGEQGGMVEIPVPQFPTGLIRARFNPHDGQFYGCGMSAWATSQMLQVGGLFRVRYTGRRLHLPVALKAYKRQIHIRFSDPLDQQVASQITNYNINTWSLKRTRNYGSDRYEVQDLEVIDARLISDNKTIILEINDLKPAWVMEINYILRGENGKIFRGTVQNTIHELSEHPEL